MFLMFFVFLENLFIVIDRFSYQYPFFHEVDHLSFMASKIGAIGSLILVIYFVNGKGIEKFRAHEIGFKKFEKLNQELEFRAEEMEKFREIQEKKINELERFNEVAKRRESKMLSLLKQLENEEKKISKNSKVVKKK